MSYWYCYMRDDLFRNLKVPRKWKKAFNACLRPVDQGHISEGLIAEALSGEFQKSFGQKGVYKMIQFLQNPELPFSASPAVGGTAGRSRIKLTPEQHRCVNLAKGMFGNGQQLGLNKALTTAMDMLISEKLRARLNQEEICINEKESNPGLVKIAILNLRKFSKVDENEIVNKFMNGNRQISFSNQIKITPDEDLS